MSNRIKSAALKILNEDNDLPITLGALSIQEVTPTFPGEIQTQQVIFTLEDDHDVIDECDDYAEEVYYIDDPDLPDLPIHPNCKCYYRDADTDEEVDILITVGAAGEGDHWITLDNGVHVLIGAGETMKEALVKHFGGKSKERTPNQVYRNEPIIVSKNAVAEHQKTGADAAARYGLDKKFATEQARKADGEQRKVLDANRGAVNSYLTGMSDYYFKLDSGIKNTKKPDCPPVIHKITGCL